MKIANAKHEKGQIEREKEGKERHSGAESAHQEKRGEDEPTHKVQAEGVEEGSLADLSKTGLDGETTGGQNDGERQPETSVGGEGGSTESVADSHFPGVVLEESKVRMNGARHIPHAGEQLNETSIPVGKSNNETRRANAFCVDVDQRQDESRESESTETERSRVGELAVRWAVETRLEITTEGSKAHLRIVGSDVGKRVATVVVGCSLPGESTVAILGVINAVGLLVDTGAALSRVSCQILEIASEDCIGLAVQLTATLLFSNAVAIVTSLGYPY